MVGLTSLLPQRKPLRLFPRITAPAAVIASSVFLILMVVISLFADFIAPSHYATQDLLARMRPPAFLGGDSRHWLGTDNLGRDLLSRLVYAVRTSILIAVCGTLLGAVFGTLLGLLAARAKGLVDQAIMMLVDVQASIPALFLALTLLAFFGNNIFLFIILVSVDGWERYTRLARGLVVSEQESDYVRAVEAFGARSGRIVLRHILPNMAAPLVVQATINFPGTVLLETSLSFLGLGVQPPGTSLGLMLGEGRRYLLNAWWIAVMPGMLIFLTTLSMSIFGDWLRDRLDPTSNHRS